MPNTGEVNTNPPIPSGPQFSVGDQVIIVGPSELKGRHGYIAQVVEGPLQHMYRYDVQLEDGSVVRCFGFELTLAADAAQSA